MNAICAYATSINYGDVDRQECLLLSGFFKLLQEAAILHANQYNTGTSLIIERGESWVLNRLAARLDRYPRYGESVRVDTWSRRVVGFRGYREYRLYAADTLIASSSSVWVYVDMRTKSLARVPQEVVDNFPQIETPAYHEQIDKLSTPAPDTDSRTEETSLRYSDVDANGHVNNTAYLDFLQTALARCHLNVHPRELQIRFMKEIAPDARAVAVRVDPSQPPSTLFSIDVNGTICAQGLVRD